jgi:hypothetical protein
MAIRSLKTGTISRSALAGNALSYPGSYEAIGVVDVGGTAQSSITFSSIPGTYKHLQLRVFARTNGSGQDRSSIALKINVDTTAANYSYHYLGGDGANPFAGSTASSGTNNYIGGISNITAANAATSIFGVAIIDILDYANTNKHKTIRTLTGQDQNGTSGRLSLASGRWGSSNAITSVELIPEYGSFIQYSSFALYGIN